MVALAVDDEAGNFGMVGGLVDIDSPHLSHFIETQGCSHDFASIIHGCLRAMHLYGAVCAFCHIINNIILDLVYLLPVYCPQNKIAPLASCTMA